jgi:hypothetical protein
MKIVVYFFICCINDYETVVSNIYSYIKNSSLYEKIYEIRCCIYSENDNYMNHEFFADNKVKIINKLIQNGGNTSEKYMLDILLNECKVASDDFYVLYLHSKGVSSHYDTIKKENIKCWTNYMLYFNIEKHDFIINKLQEYDAIGVNLNGHSSKPFYDKFENLNNLITNEGWCGPSWPMHFSGNFWWSKSSYIKQICYCDDSYPGAEIWITNGNRGEIGKFLSLWNAHTNLYDNKYTENNYVDKELQLYDRSN